MLSIVPVSSNFPIKKPFISSSPNVKAGCVYVLLLHVSSVQASFVAFNLHVSLVPSPFFTFILSSHVT